MIHLDRLIDGAYYRIEDELGSKKLDLTMCFSCWKYGYELIQVTFTKHETICVGNLWF